MIIKEFLRYGNKLCIIKKRIASDRINDVQSAKDFYGAEHCVKNPQNPYEYIFLEVIPELEYEQISKPEGHVVEQHNEEQQKENEHSYQQ